ncbi:Crl family RNA polymerase assembly factor, partial [Photobacterium phosphoreum]|uniref:Crl family RNA polymerase assembly factor n=1 Tax=Photobacterium phosphoreum TaxID=659 RepID=UPI000CF50DE0
TPQRFFFDCLASCVNAEKDPELREFWGWWLVMTATETGYEYEYDFGRFNAAGEWANGKLPAKHRDAVLKTLVDFYPKLTPFIVDECELTLVPAATLTQTPLAELLAK